MMIYPRLPRPARQADRTGAFHSFRRNACQADWQNCNLDRGVTFQLPENNITYVDVGLGSNSCLISLQICMLEKTFIINLTGSHIPGIIFPALPRQPLLGQYLVPPTSPRLGVGLIRRLAGAEFPVKRWLEETNEICSY